MPNRTVNKKFSPKSASVKDPSSKKKERRNLENTVNEKDILLSLNNDIASVKDKKDILKIIHPKLKMLFNTDRVMIYIPRGLRRAMLSKKPPLPWAFTVIPAGILEGPLYIGVTETSTISPLSLTLFSSESPNKLNDIQISRHA